MFQIWSIIELYGAKIDDNICVLFIIVRLPEWKILFNRYNFEFHLFGYKLLTLIEYTGWFHIRLAIHDYTFWWLKVYYIYMLLTDICSILCLNSCSFQQTYFVFLLRVLSICKLTIIEISDNCYQAANMGI